MINNINVKNYKAFKEGSFKIKPLTLLLGANSSGKSSILQLILLLEQSLNLDETYESAIKLNGKYINLGEDENIIRNKDNESEVLFEFDFKDISFNKVLKSTIDRIKKQISEMFVLLNYIGKYPHKQSNQRDFIDFLSRSMISSNRKQNLENILEEMDYLVEDLERREIQPQQIKYLLRRTDFRYFFSHRINYNLESILNFKSEEFKDASTLFEPLSKLRFRNVKLGYKLRYSSKTKKLEISENYISIQKKKLLSINVNGQKLITSISSDILDNELLQKYNVNDYLIFNSLELKVNNENQPKNSNLILDSIVDNFNELFKHLKEEFESEKINYVGPLRAYPQRYYFLDEANVNTSLNIFSGNNLAEILKKKHSTNSRVNKWLNKFGLGVSVKEFKDIIHNIKVKQNGLDLDITDVGFGISQILPILVQGFMSSKDSTTIIEQPEIHLHPKMQADLADLFIDIIYDKNLKSGKIHSGRSLLIETHSEYILRRIRRRISEGKLDNKDVAIYFIDPRLKPNQSAKIREIKISQNGSFDWPIDYYETELEDNIAFLQNLSEK